MKENDIILNMLANPKFTLEDFQAVGLNSDNTGLQSEDKYLQSDKIKSVSAFQDSNGQFDKNDVLHYNYIDLTSKKWEVKNYKPI